MSRFKVDKKARLNSTKKIRNQQPHSYQVGTKQVNTLYFVCFIAIQVIHNDDSNERPVIQLKNCFEHNSFRAG